MKKTIFLTTFCGLLVSSSTSCFAGSKTLADLSLCDETHSGGQLEYNKGYEFGDTWNNGRKEPIYLADFWIYYADTNSKWQKGSARFWNYLDQGGKFDWTKELKGAKFKISGNSKMRIFGTTSNWRMAKKGSAAKGTKDDFDFIFMYKKEFDLSDTPKDKTDNKTFSSCVFYGIK